MTYVTEQTSEELRAHMRRLQKMPGWHNPLDDRLFAEVLALDAQVKALRKAAVAVPEAVERDAARYRHLVETCNVDFDPSEPWQLVIWEPSTGKDWKEELDADIDSAIDRLAAPEAGAGGGKP